MALTDQVIMPGSDYQAICDATRKLTGETATLKSGEIYAELDLVTPLYEMWVLSKEGVAEGNMNIAAHHFYTRTLDEEFTGIIFSVEDGSLRYIRPDGSNLLVAEVTRQIGENEYQYSWVGNPEYRAIVCKTPPTGALLTWLQANGVKQASYTAVETNHTCSGTVFDLQNSTITSETPYDAMQKVTLNITIPEQEKTVSPTETSQTVTPDTHKVLSKVTVNPISPTYVGSAIPRRATGTVTPTASEQIAVKAGMYTLGNVKVAAVPTEMKVADLSMASGNQVISNTSGKYMTSVTVKKPSTLIPSNIKKGVDIGGVVGTVEEQHTTVVFAATDSLSGQLQAMATKRIDKKFINNGVEYVSIQYNNYSPAADIYYMQSNGTARGVYSSSTKWLDDTFRKVTFLETLEEDLVTILDSINAEYWVGDYAIQATRQIDITKDDVGTNFTMQANSPYDVVDRIDVDVQNFSTGVDLPFTKLATVSTDNGILSFSFTGYYNTIIAKRSGTNKILTAVFGNNLKASFSIESEGDVLSTSSGFSYNQVGNKFNVTWNISNSSGSVWYEGSYDIYGCSNG